MLLGVGALVVAVYGWDYPRERLSPATATSLTVVDRRGRPLRQVPLRGGGRQTWTRLADVPAPLVLATIASEDERFFGHGGVDPWGVVRAAWLDLRAGRAAYGGSTISMQLVRMIEPRPRTLGGKLREAVLALRLERAATKEEILEQYLNRAYYGAGAYGVEAAARRYFGKPATALSAAEATLLAVVPRGPTAYDPLRHLARARARRAHVLGLLVARGLMTDEERARIEAEPLRLVGAPPPERARHFVDAVVAALPEAERLAGGVVETTLDADLTQDIERLVAERVDPRLDAAVVVIEPASGDVLAMVGARDYARSQLNLATTPRQPGSTLKPFIYALALERGDTAASVALDLADVPSAFVLQGETKEHGPARYREALAGSYNLAAIHVLEKVGVPALAERLARAGVVLPAAAVAEGDLRIAVGSAPVRLVDLTAAFAVFVEGGRARPARTLRRAPPRPFVRVFSEESAAIIADILADPDARRSTFGVNLPVDLPFPVIVKTGTSAGFADTWTLAATREAVVGVWVGALDGSGTQGTTAMWTAAPLARAVLLLLAGGRGLTLPPLPASLERHAVCAVSGMAPGPRCPQAIEPFARGTAPREACSWHRADGSLVYPAVIARTRWAKTR